MKLALIIAILALAGQLQSQPISNKILSGEEESLDDAAPQNPQLELSDDELAEIQKELDGVEEVDLEPVAGAQRRNFEERLANTLEDNIAQSGSASAGQLRRQRLYEQGRLYPGQRRANQGNRRPGNRRPGNRNGRKTSCFQ